MSAIVVFLLVLAIALVVLGMIALIKKPASVYQNQPDQKNPMEGKQVVFIEDADDPENADGVRGHLKATGNSPEMKSDYVWLKRIIDIILSFGGLVLLLPIFL